MSSFGCQLEEAPQTDVGELSLSLSTEAGGTTYRVSNAQLTLEGPTKQELRAGDEESLELELPAGAYTLRLQDGYQLVRSDDAQVLPVNARLVSANPMPVLVSAGQTARVTLRFELAAENTMRNPGKLAIDVRVTQPDAATSCTDGLLISEVDYDQVGADDAELVEVVNTAACDVALAGVSLELLNGTDGKVYGRYDLSKAAPTLAAGARLLVADEAVLQAAGSNTKGIALTGTGLQNGPDAVRLTRGDSVIDVMAYEAVVPGAGTSFSVADEAGQSLSRCAETSDTDDASQDFRLTAPTPGAPNACG